MNAAGNKVWTDPDGLSTLSIWANDTTFIMDGGAKEGVAVTGGASGHVLLSIYDGGGVESIGLTPEMSQQLRHALELAEVAALRGVK